MLSRSAHLALFAILLLPLAASARPQSQTASGTQSGNLQQPRAIQTTTRLVQVSVIVQDKSGASITGLKKQDFKLFDDGALQEIAFFSSTTPARMSPHPLPPNVFTNRSDLTGKEPGEIIIILYDELNTSFEDQAYARQHILRFLKSIRPQDHVAIFALTSDLLVLHSFSDDSVALANSVNRFSPQLTAAFEASHPANFNVPALENDPFWKSFEGRVNGANAEIADAATDDRYRATYAAFMAIADYVANIPGRKSLVWVSGGIPIDIGTTRIGVPDRDSLHLWNTSAPGMTANKNLGGLAGVLNRVDMAIYPIDAHGIVRPPGQAPSSRVGLCASPSTSSQTPQAGKHSSAPTTSQARCTLRLRMGDTVTRLAFIPIMEFGTENSAKSKSALILQIPVCATGAATLLSPNIPQTKRT